MKPLKNISFIFCLIICGSTILKAQMGTVTSGGVATGTNGNVSFSIGQSNCISPSGTGGTINQGVQQPYGIFTTTGIEEKNINLVYAAYPNPTSDFIVLSVSNIQTLNMNFSLIDLLGRTLLNQKINDVQTKINFTEISSGTYFIKVSDDNNILKTFKIIKY